MNRFDFKNFNKTAWTMSHDDVKTESLAILEEWEFIYNDWKDDICTYLAKGYLISWPQGTATCSARGLACSRVYGVYHKKVEAGKKAA